MNWTFFLLFVCHFLPPVVLSYVATHTPEVHADCVSQVSGTDLLPLVQLLDCHSRSRQTAKCVSQLLAGEKNACLDLYFSHGISRKWITKEFFCVVKKKQHLILYNSGISRIHAYNELSIVLQNYGRSSWIRSTHILLPFQTRPFFFSSLCFPSHFCRISFQKWTERAAMKFLTG